MSLYSGFSTRMQEEQYNKLLENLIDLLQSRLFFYMKKYPCPDDNTWVSKFSTIYKSMKNLEHHKYLEPKFSESCKEITGHFLIDFYTDTSYNNFNRSRLGNRVNNSIKLFATPRKKIQSRSKIHSQKDKSTDNIAMSQYYGKIMENIVRKSNSRINSKKKHKSNIETQDFWLLDDQIAMINHDF